MITDRMTPEEIEKDLMEDLKVVNGYVKQLVFKLRRNAIKTNMEYPHRGIYNYTSKRKNNWILQVDVMSKQKVKDGEVSMLIACVYDTDHGKYAAVRTSNNELKFLLFPPHFFKRYRERKHLDSSILTQDLILKFFNENPGNVTYYDPAVDPERSVKVITKEGMLFGMLLTTQVAIIKTFVGEEQLFENQKRIKSEVNEIEGLNKLLDGTALMKSADLDEDKGT